MLVLLDLSDAFDTIGHDNVFCILEKYIGICENVANIICSVPQGSGLGPLTFCLYLLPMSAIFKYHKIVYQVYDDDTQLYIAFKCKQPLEAISKVNSCLQTLGSGWLLIS